MSDDIIVVGTQEIAEIVGENVVEHICPKCQHVVKISSGLIIEGDNMSITETDTITCPKCLATIKILEPVV